MQGFVLICFPLGSVSLQHVNNKTGSMTWLDKHLYISRKKERSGFIIDGTILGSYLWSLIERCVFSRPWEKEKNKQTKSKWFFVLVFQESKEAGEAWSSGLVGRHWGTLAIQTFEDVLDPVFISLMLIGKGYTGTPWDSNWWKETDEWMSNFSSFCERVVTCGSELKQCFAYKSAGL